MFSSFPPPRNSSTATRWSGQPNPNKAQLLYRPPSSSPSTASASLSSSSASRPQTAVPRPQSGGGHKSAFLSYSNASPRWSAAPTEPAEKRREGEDIPVPFCLLDSIQSHQRAAAQSSRHGRPTSSNRPRRAATPDFADDGDSDVASSSSPLSKRDSERLSHQRQQSRESHLRDSEERKEPETSLSSSSSPLRSSVSSPLSIQRSIHLLHASPLLAHYLPLLTDIDSHWSRLISHQAPHRRSEADAMQRLRSEETGIRDGLLAFLRVSCEYRRRDLHDDAGRWVGQGEEEEGEVGRGWLVEDEDQSGGLEVDWRGRYWQSERRREKEGWYRVEERQLQGLYERGVQLTTQLYDRRFSQLIQRAQDDAASRRRQPHSQSVTPHSSSAGFSPPPPLLSPFSLCVLSADAESTRLHREIHEVLTALQEAGGSESSAETRESNDPPLSSLLPPGHPSLSLHARSLHAQLSSLSSSLSSHFQQVASVVDRCQALTSSSSTLDDLMRQMNEEDRQRRDEVQGLTEQLRLQREEAASREEDWSARLAAERLQRLRGEEEAKRVEAQLADLRDSLRQIEAEYKADRQRRLDRADAASQCDAAAYVATLGDAGRGGGSHTSGPAAVSLSALQLRLPLPQEEKVSPRSRSPRSQTPLSARSLSVAAALAAADRGGGGAKGAKSLPPQRSSKDAERLLTRGKAGAARSPPSSAVQPEEPLSARQEGEGEGQRTKPWDGIPDV